MPLYIPWLSETIKKRCVRYLLHHYLGQFFEEKLTLEQLSIDIFEGKGSIKNLCLDVDGLNDELDFIPFKFLEGCLIGQISVEVPWSSLATEACKVELEGAKFVCRLKTSSDGGKTHCAESTLLSRSLMTSSMQMAEDIVTTEDDEDYESPASSIYRHKQGQESPAAAATPSKRKNANQMFEGLEMFAQLIDSVLRRTKLTARNTMFQIQPHPDERHDEEADEDSSEAGPTFTKSRQPTSDCFKSASGEEFNDSETFKSDTDESEYQSSCSSEGTVEFFIRFFRCEEVIDESRVDLDYSEQEGGETSSDTGPFKRPLSAMPETITKLLTLEDVEMRIGGTAVSNLIGKHTIMIKFNGQKSEISIFSGSPLLAVIGHEQLKTFFNVFDGAKPSGNESSPACENNQKIMSPEDYAKIENQLLESVNLRAASFQVNELSSGFTGGSSHVHHLGNLSQAGGRRWIDSNDLLSSTNASRQGLIPDFDYHLPNPTNNCSSGKSSELGGPTLDNIEAFSCELKLPGIWLCILKDGEKLPPLIKPYADSINSFHTINKYIDEHIKVPHIRCLALKVALDITISGINVFLGDLDISEYLPDNSMNPTLHLLHNDVITPGQALNASRYKAAIVNNKDITIDLLTKTRIILDPTMLDRIVYDYKLIDLGSDTCMRNSKRDYRFNSHTKSGISNNQLDLNLTIRGEQFKVELLCPIPDLTEEGVTKPSQLRPQSFLFDFRSIVLNWDLDKLKVSALELSAYVKTSPKQNDNEAVRFIDAISKNSDKIVLTLETSPSNLDTAFPNDIEQALNESSMYDSIYIGQPTESQTPVEAFQTKRKVVRASMQGCKSSSTTSADLGGGKQDGNNRGISSECDNEKIVTPGDREHLLEYLNQTVSSTKLSIGLHLPICEVEFEDKEQLDLIYNRFGNDFVFWQPKAKSKGKSSVVESSRKKKSARKTSIGQNFLIGEREDSQKHSLSETESDTGSEEGNKEDDELDDQESEVSFHSLNIDGLQSESYDNEITCKITVDEMLVRFNHQSCAAALKQDMSAENFLLGVVLDVNKKPGTIISLVADNLELSTDLDVVLSGNSFGNKNSIFALTAEIKRPTTSLKDIKLAIQLVNGLFSDFKTETYTRFWQSINVTDEPILGYVAPKIVTELHVDILNTALSLVREGARPALLAIDELYLTSMVMEQTSQVMIRLIADEVSLYLKRNRQGLEMMKNYICLIDSGLIDLDIKFSQDGKLEFGVINNVITIRACQDSLSALFRLFSIMTKSNNTSTVPTAVASTTGSESNHTAEQNQVGEVLTKTTEALVDQLSVEKCSSNSSTNENLLLQEQEMNLLEDAMNDFGHVSSSDELDRSSNMGSIKGEFCGSDSGEQGFELSEKRRIHDRGSYEAESTDISNHQEDDLGEESSEYSDSETGLPVLQATTSTSKRRDPNACLLDESNPLIDDLLSQPLLQPEQKQQQQLDNLTNSLNSDFSRPMDEEGFFVIGDDDVGAGIIDKLQREPVVRKLTNKPINIIENHFKMTKPRTIPEMLASSLERYILEEMTLVVNLYGGRDFDDDCLSTSSEANSATPTNNHSSTAPSTTTGNEENTHELSGEQSDAISAESGSIRSRAGSLAGSVKRSSINRKHYSSECSAGNSSSTIGGPPVSAASSLKRKGGLSGRRKHLSESRDHNKNQSAVEQRVRFGEGAVNLWESLDLMSSPDFFGTRRPSQPPLSSDTKVAGGTWRQTDVCIQLTLTKVKLLYELGGASSPISWRFMLFIHDIEIKDRIHASDINKMLYEYCTESMPKRNTQLLTIKNTATINPSDGCEECDLRVSLKPLRLNIDQDTLLFLIEFFTSFGKSLSKHQQQQSGHQGSGCPSSSSFTTTTTTTTTVSSSRAKEPTTLISSETVHATFKADGTPIGGVQLQSQEKGAKKHHHGLAPSEHNQTLATTNSSGPTSSSSSSSSSSYPSPPTVRASSQTQGQSAASTSFGTKVSSATAPDASTARNQERPNLPTHCHRDNVAGSNGQQPIYIKSFTFSPDVPIRLDYHAKHLDFEQGALAGILMGLAHLDHSELVLRRVQAKHGMRGLDRVLLFTLNSWISDIKRNQLPSILSGVGPMHSVIQLFQGMRDLIWMPIDHYRKDRRLVRGLQRGASSFSSSTAMAAINLMNRFISIVQCTAQIAHDIVTPPSFHHSSSGGLSAGGIGGGSGRNLSARDSRYNSAHLASPHDFSDTHHHHHGRHHGTCKSSASASSIVALNQPRNFCEGVAVGFTILKEGFNDTARNVAVGMQAEDVRSAVGELVRQIPSTLLNPIISATEGAQNVLVGIRNQIAPDARREDQEKWKRRVRGK